MRILSALVVTLLVAFPFSANAVVVYDVSDTGKLGCKDRPHGLWTNKEFGDGNPNGCKAKANFFSIQDGTQFILYNDSADSSDWYATLTGTAQNGHGQIASIDLTFENYLDALIDPYKYKVEGGSSYNPDAQDFFTDVNGSIDVYGNSYAITDFVPGYTFQYGLGANAKRADEHGGSAWVQSADIDSHHWDLNLKFEKASVPEPSILMLMLLGLVGLVGFRGRQAR